MQISPEVIADSFVSLASLIGLVLLARVLRRQRPRPAINQRFLFAIHVVIVIMAARLLQWFTDLDGFGRVAYGAASVLPLAAVLVVETVLRRHAPRFLKTWAAFGAVLFVLIAVFAGNGYALAALLALAGFQALTFGALAALLVWRDRDDVSPAENTMIDRLGLSLVLIVPLALTDFRTDMMDLPVRLSGIAVLVFCWLALTLRRGSTTQSGIVSAFLGLALVLSAAALAIAALADLDARAIVQVMAIIVSAGVLAGVYSQTRAIKRDARQGVLLDVLANAPVTDHATFIAALQTRALTSGALVLSGDSLADFDTRFEHHFEGQPIVRSSGLDQIAAKDVMEQFEWFFRKFDANHAMMVSRHPFQIMALNIPALAQSGPLERELQVAQRLAMLLAERGAPGD